jgi:phosphohistidine swiveling domain-containing protein
LSFVIGDDLVTTNDRTIETASDQGLINAALIKANQIGSLYETLLAMLVALGKGQDLVVSHRSKSPNDDMEAQIALSVNSLGLKAGGGANTERLVKYQAVTELMLKVAEAGGENALRAGEKAVVRKVRAYEEPTNAGIPTVGVTLELALPSSGVLLKFKGATPLGTSAGTGEAIHLVDAMIEQAEYREIISRFPGFFEEVESGVFSFTGAASEPKVRAAQDEGLTALFERALRYRGKGCLNAVDHVLQIIAPYFEQRNVADFSLKDIDSALLGLELNTARRRGKIGEQADTASRVRVMQRKQNLGMNAMLSASLALARAIAHVQGKELYELLREEMLSIIDQLAGSFQVAVHGSSFSDYVIALREVSQILEEQDRPLYEVLREQTGIYTAAEELPAKAPADEPFESVDRIPETAPPGPENIKGPALSEPTVRPSNRGIEVPLPENFSVAEKEIISALNRKLFQAYVDSDEDPDVEGVLRSYLEAKAEVAYRVGRFGIVNNRIFRQDGWLLVPYLLADTLILHAVRNGATELVSVHRFPHGTIYTDHLIGALVDADGTPIDFEQKISFLDAEHQQEPKIARIRDIASLLKNVNEATNRNQALYLLRHLVARLCNLSVKTFLGAKNLQPEVNNLNTELMRFINGPLWRRFPALTRTIVRNLSGVIGKPNLIDRLWNDTIYLAEVDVRGSAIVNELRRSSHHALGRRTLLLAQAYLDYLANGDTAELARLGFGSPAESDVEARKREGPRLIVERVVEDLGRLLGTSETVARIEEWQESYAENLLQCQFGISIQDEAETLVSKGIHARNRWAYYHHLRILLQKVEDFSKPEDVTSDFKRCLEALQELRPDDVEFDADMSETTVREGLAAFVEGIQNAYQRELFGLLRSVLEANETHHFFETFTKVRGLRKKLQGMIRVGGFTAQRYFLLQLDCLLEEMNYLALRRIATAYSDDGVDLDQCLEIIRISILNLKFDGLFSRELFDLAGLLSNPARTEAELLDVLSHVGRHYHKIRQRVTVPYEKMHRRLGLEEENLRTVLANMQRYMHDLNSVVQFADFARADILEQQTEDVPPRQSEPQIVGGSDSSHAIIHISHRDEVAREMANDEDQPSLREQYGGKGSSLLYVSNMNLPTRDGFILPTSIPRANLHRDDPGWLAGEIEEHLRILENDIARLGTARRRFGDEREPMVLAVRGGSVFSMPGMLSTIVFVGMNDRIAEALASQGPWRAYDSYRRFLASYGLAIWGVDLEGFNLVDDVKSRYGVEYKTQLPWEAMREIAESSKSVLCDHGFAEELENTLQNPRRQLLASVLAVFESWNKETAQRYREIKGISHSWQTAAIVQEMAFGNGRNKRIEPGMDETRASLTGVIPRTAANELGTRELSGEFKFSAAGDDLVGGVTSSGSFHSIAELDTLMPMLGRRMRHEVSQLRRFMGTDQEVEFTVESGVLSVLQSRTAETAADEATDRFVDPGEAATRGLGVRGGGFRGMVAFDEADREELIAIDFATRDDVDGVLMVLENPTPEEIPMIISADGLLTAKGGSTSHAAVAANGIEDRVFCSVMSASGLQVDLEKREAVIVDAEGAVRHRFRKGDILSLHGTSGEVYIGSRSLRQIGADVVNGVE